MGYPSFSCSRITRPAALENPDIEVCSSSLYLSLLDKMPVYAITGANRGLGLEFVRQLLSDSSNTVIGAVRSLENDLSELKALDKDGHLHILECDTSSSASISKFADGVAKILGKNQQIHYLLNNAGINAVPDQTSLDLTETDLQQHISVNVFGPAKTVQVLLPHLQKGSVIMNMVWIMLRNHGPG
jgi:NAD(P)-dependent dehydrogenase (short-subunit alcohol dehydrogenase family)